MGTYKYRVVIEQDEDGVYVASYPTLQGCYTQGDTYDEALANIKEAIQGQIAARKRVGDPVPIEVALQ